MFITEISRNSLICIVMLLLLVDKSMLHKSNFKRVLQPRIHGGLQAYPHQFAYQASLRRVEATNFNTVRTSHYCGGALISDRWIVTAAHCTSGKNTNYDTSIIVLGAHHLTEGGTWYGFESVINHPKYKLYENDISLIRTDRRVHFTNEIKPIRLSREVVGETGRASFAGWGLDESGYSPLHLQYLHVEIIGNDICMKSHLPEYASLIFNTTICTLGARKTGTCYGDSGGPLVKDDKLIGVISWGIPCALGVPDQHTRISSYLQWINSNIGVVAT